MTKHPLWFRRIRGSYLPAAWQGWVLYAFYLAYVVCVALYVIGQHPSIWQGCLVIAPNWISALVVITWIAERTSKRA